MYLYAFFEGKGVWSREGGFGQVLFCGGFWVSGFGVGVGVGWVGLVCFFPVLVIVGFCLKFQSMKIDVGGCRAEC